jgi:CheY-like chemotaxis protein
MIGDAGYDVIEVGNADEAIAILEGRPDIEVVFMDGVKLARRVKRKWPAIKIIATLDGSPFAKATCRKVVSSRPSPNPQVR